MDEVIAGLFISSLELAGDHALLRERNISAIVCIGCEPLYPDQYEYCSFPGLLDVPETNLMTVFPESCAFLSRILSGGSRAALVHCVYGQSRSAALIVAQLVCNNGYTLEDALATLKRAHPTICINPGFLSQLHLYYHRRLYSVEYLLACGTAEGTQAGRDSGSSDQDSAICCLSCGVTLCSTRNQLVPRNADEFLAKYTDDFWKGYRSPLASHGGIARPGDPGLLLFGKLICDGSGSSLIMESTAKRKRARGTSAVLRCSRCREELGLFQENGLAICSGFIVRDLYALLEAKIRLVAPCSPLNEIS